MPYIHAKCPSCGSEADGTFKIEWNNIISVTETLKGFNLEGAPVYGDITIYGQRADTAKCTKCGRVTYIDEFKQR